MSPLKEEDPRETDCISPFPAESRNGSNANKQPVGDQLHSTALLSTDDDDESNTKKSCHSSFKLTLVP